jgi:hypothetical protein
MHRPLLGIALLLALAAGLAAQERPAIPKPTDAPRPASKARTRPDPVPGYELRAIEGFQVLVNRRCLAEAERSKERYEVEPLEVLESEFKALNQILLPKLLKVVQGVRFWVEWDDRLADDAEFDRGGRVVAVYRSGTALTAALAARNGGPHPGKINAVEVMSLRALTDMHQPGRGKQQIILLHELCHTIHHQFLNYNNVEVKRAYQQAMDRGLYGRAYARTSDAEYFAEISCAYLDRCNFAPYTAEELKDYDPAGYQLMEKVWGKQDKIIKAREWIVKERDARLRARQALTATGSRPQPAAVPPAADPAKLAAAKLDLTKLLLKDGKADKARERLRELVKDHPDTPAAAEAKKLLGEIK